MNKVAVAIIKSQDEFGRDQYLLIQALKDLGEYTGFWYPPGGNVKEGETEEQTLIRKLKDDLNLKVKPIKKIAETPGETKDQINLWWECEIIDGEMRLLQEELADAEYFTHDQMTAIYIWPVTKKFFEEFIFKKPIK